MGPGMREMTQEGVVRYFWKSAVLALCLAPLFVAAAPDLVLRDFDGKDRNVNEFIGKGQWTVVAVWSADCPICKRDIVHMTFFHEDNRKQGATVLGLSIDEVENIQHARRFVSDQALNFPNLIGSWKDASALSGASFIGTPTYYVFSPEGKFMTQRVGPATQEEMETIIERLKVGQKKPG
jgi:peroxiredoxin